MLLQHVLMWDWNLGEAVDVGDTDQVDPRGMCALGAQSLGWL